MSNCSIASVGPGRDRCLVADAPSRIRRRVVVGEHEVVREREREHEAEPVPVRGHERDALLVEVPRPGRW